ncbi:MAG TPA: hypothetical protein VND87_11100 [Stellaceae bacterium]|nr:hypothetical protein [Stellaceae bacterium]
MQSDNSPRRNSRWSETPVLDRNRKPKAACPTERDIDGIFAPLTRYRYLPADYMHAFAGGSLDYLVNRLNLLSRQPNRYVARPPQQRANAAANHRRLIYELADKGWAVMHERGVMHERSRAPSNFAHELMTCQLLASFELGVRETANRLIAWSDILQSQNLPDATRHSPKPYLIPVTVSIDGAMIATHVAADGAPFGIGRSRGGDTAFFFCPGVEADCGTEPIDTSDFQRSSLFKKFLLYLTVEAQGIHRAHFGFPNLYVPFVTTNATRMSSMMKLLERITRGAGSRTLLFKTFPAFTSPGKPPPPSGHMLTEDWQRVGHPPFNFLKS